MIEVLYDWAITIGISSIWFMLLIYAFVCALKEGEKDE